MYSTSLSIPQKGKKFDFGYMKVRDDTMYNSNQFAKNIMLENSKDEREKEIENKKLHRDKARTELQMTLNACRKKNLRDQLKNLSVDFNA